MIGFHNLVRKSRLYPLLVASRRDPGLVGKVCTYPSR